MIPIGIIYNFLNLLFGILNVSILAEVILSYIPSVRESEFYRMLMSFNYPIIEPFRKLQQKFFGNMMIDFAPLIAIIVIDLIRGILF